MKSTWILSIAAAAPLVTTYACGGGSGADNGASSAGDAGPDSASDASSGAIDGEVDSGAGVLGDGAPQAPVSDPAGHATSIDDATRVIVSRGRAWVQINGAKRNVFGAVSPDSSVAVVETSQQGFLSGQISSFQWSYPLGAGDDLTDPGVGRYQDHGSWFATGAMGRTMGNITTGMANYARIRGADDDPNILINALAADSPRVSGEVAAPCGAGKSTLAPGGGCINPGAAAFVFGSTTNNIEATAPGQATIDALMLAPDVDGKSSDLIIAGRLDGAGTFAFGENTVVDGGVSGVSGPAIYVARFSPGAGVPGGALLWLQAFSVDGVLPIAGTPMVVPTADEVGFGVRLDRNQVDGGKIQILTAHFRGSMKIDKNTVLTAPGDSYATAVVGIDITTGTVTNARSFGKGPLSAAKPSHAMAMLIDQGPGLGSEVYFADTVWDTISFGAGKSASSVNGGDVAIAVLDQQWNAKAIRVYGGAGNDEPLGIAPPVIGTTGVDVYGRSNAAVDFGTGALAPSAGKSAVWFAEFSTIK